MYHIANNNTRALLICNYESMTKVMRSKQTKVRHGGGQSTILMDVMATWVEVRHGVRREAAGFQLSPLTGHRSSPELLVQILKLLSWAKRRKHLETFNFAIARGRKDFKNDMKYRELRQILECFYESPGNPVLW